MTILTFPEGLRKKIAEDDFPHIKFTTSEKFSDFQAIHIFMPQGVASADGATYGSTNLGLLGAVAEGTNTGNELTGSDIVGQGIQKIKADAGGMITAAAVQAELKRGIVVNPFTTQTFDGTVLRSFAFQFKLVPESAKESKLARQIENAFRKYLYPDTPSPGQMKYPPRWRVQFFAGDTVNKYMPRMIESYLINMTSTYNSAGNSFHAVDADGAAPVEIDLNLTFQEVRAITRDDLYDDNGLGYTNRDPETFKGVTDAGGEG